VISLFPTKVVSAKHWLKAGSGDVYAALQEMARTGEYNCYQLDQVLASGVVKKDRELQYALASLYMQLRIDDVAVDLLKRCGVGREMKHYFAVLNYAHNHSLAIPSLTAKQEHALRNINDRLRCHNSLIHRIEQAGGFSVVGNAPDDSPGSSYDGLCTFYFNHYRKNPSLEGVASVHVVTPSWTDFSNIQSDAVLLSGNSIFHRRSSVWERFTKTGCISSIYTVPREVWAGLYTALGTSPSAGLLVLSWLSELLRSEELEAKSLQGHVNGFSLNSPTVNHSFDNAVLSSAHNWTLEPQMVEQVINRLRYRLDNFHSKVQFEESSTVGMRIAS